MAAAYREIRTEMEPDARTLRISFRLENRGRATWRASDGLCIGCQIVDPETGRFFEEGEWTPLASDVAPGQSADCVARVRLPADEGSYRIYVSPRTNSAGWLYERGEELLVADASVGSGIASYQGAEVTTLGRLGRRNLLRSMRRAVAGTAASLWRNRDLILSMTRRDLAARYRGSFADTLWAVLNPLLLLGTYFFVFGVVLQTRNAMDLVAGMLPWLAFSEAVGRAPSAMLENRHLVKKIVFPIEIIAVQHTLSALVTQAVGTVIFFVALGIAGGGLPPLSSAWLAVLLVPQVLLTAGTSWALSALGVFLRDLIQIIGPLLTLLFFLTPICYPEEPLLEAMGPAYRINPIYMLVRGWRAALLEGAAPPLWTLVAATLAGLVVMFAGLFLFERLRRSFADAL
jgi:lipopolysaccharide transport system permease protein